MSPQAPIKLYRHPLSGHAHRAQLMLSLLGLPHELIDIDFAKGEHKTPAFLELNPFGQVPVIDDKGTVVHDSNAILVYLALTYDASRRWLPQEPKLQAAIQTWFAVAAGPIAFGPAAARVINLFGRKDDPSDAIARAHALLKVMDAQLGTRDFLVGAAATLADVSVYTYIAVAPEGNVDLAPYPQVRAWLARVEALPGFVAMRRTPIGLAT